MTKLKSLWNKYKNNETMRITSSSGVCKTIYGTKYSRMDQVKFVEDSL